MSHPELGDDSAQTAYAFARAILPPGKFLEGFQPKHLETVYRELQGYYGGAPRILEKICSALDLVALAQTGRRFARLSEQRRQELVIKWHRSASPVGQATAILATLFKLYYFDSPELFEHFGVPHDKAPKNVEAPPAHMQNVVRGDEMSDEELEADVVVVGSGAAGAIVAKELAQQGFAVLIVEAGKYHGRTDFSGQAVAAFSKFYNWKPRNLVLGNAFMPLPTGTMVGGSTTINTATCFRPPEWVHRGWVNSGLPELSQEAMAGYFDEVEAVMQVAPAPAKYFGASVEALARVAEERNYRHRPMDRNAPECDAQNACDMGCPSGGKYSMDLAYIPMALRHGAFLLTETRLERLVIRNGEIKGARLRSKGKAVQVKAKHVVLSCGTLVTPEILWDHDLGGPAVGQGLTIHPSCSVSARLPQKVRCFDELIPSPYMIDEFEAQKLMLISANLPLDFAAMPLQLVGHRLIDEMERYDHFGTWGALLAETVKGRLRRLPGGEVITTYNMNKQDVQRVQSALALISELFFEAGAEQCFPGVRTWPRLRDKNDLKAFREAKIGAGDLVLTAYHPLGTCVMGNDPKTSVVRPDYSVPGVEGLSVVDGSVIPGPLGVNSQVTVMAFARRAVDHIAPKLDG
jgi:hypothetical protein